MNRFLSIPATVTGLKELIDILNDTPIDHDDESLIQMRMTEILPGVIFEIPGVELLELTKEFKFDPESQKLIEARITEYAKEKSINE